MARDAAIEPGKIRKLLVGEKHLVLCRVGDRLVATDFLCPHSGEELTKGWMNDVGDLVCPWHQYQFSLRDGRENKDRYTPLGIYRVTEENGQYFLNIS